VRLSRRAVRRIAAEVKAAGLPTLATRANFVLVNTGSDRQAAALSAALLRRGVAIRNRSHLPGMAGWVRVSAGTDGEVDHCLDVLRLLLAPEPAALLFDMDHVLVDVSHSYDEAIVRTVASFLPPGRAVDRETVLAVKRRPDANDDVDASVLALARLGQKPPRREVERRFQQLYLGARGKPGLYRREQWLFPLAGLKRLAARFPLGIVTGRPRAEANLALKRSGAGRYFRAVITMDDVRRKKPDPAPIRAALKKLRVDRAWMVGDGPADLLAARRAGIAAVGVRGNGASAARRDGDLRAYHPLAVLNAARDLVLVFEERDRVAAEGA
jgi:HAD superfamily hydrolase (TIGR01548 family)